MHRFVTIPTQGMDTATGYRLVCGAVAPRPVAWITTLGADGRVNAAPFSAYNYVAHTPPMLGVSIASRAGELKDTARNIRASGHFVVNVATQDTMEAMHLSAADYPPDVSETTALGIELLPGVAGPVPRIAAAPIQMECRLDQFIALGRGLSTLYIGEVLAFHLADSIFDGRHIDTMAMKPIARLGGPYYAALGEIFHRPALQRPPGEASESTSV